MIKTKILKVLPYWLIFLITFSAAEVAVFLIETNSTSGGQSAQTAAYEPAVLGASTSLRGDAPEKTLTLVKIKEVGTEQISAKSFLVFDLETGKTLLEKNARVKLSIASLTKLLTAFVAYQNSDLNTIYKLPNNKVTNVRPILGLVPGDEVKALDLFNAMLIGSVNDAGQTLAQYVSSATGKNFPDLMNNQAEALGMVNSHFSNPIGFDSQYNYSTAEDLKVLILATEKLSAFTNLGRRKSYEFSGKLEKPYFAKATNTLLQNHPDIEAIKTGFTENAGGAMATKFKLEGREVVILVLGSENREQDTLLLKDAATSGFKAE